MMGWSAVDGLAFFTRKYILFSATVVLSIMGWMLLFTAVFKSNVRENIRRMCAGVLIILAFVAPHCFFKYFHPAELHLYSVVAGVAIFVGCVRISKREMFGVWSGAVCLMILFVLGWCDKIAEIYDRSRRMEDVLNKIAETRISLESSVAFVVKEDPSIRCYSVFSQQVIHGFGENTALRSLNGWRDTKALVVTPEAVSSLPSDMRVVRLD
jgi:UDP-N-acetylmuramyl pentapeptide phosphotransferase/UDP-N-acetylglucosamine-1-phosphate transferase